MTYFDLVLLIIVVISGLLAMARGFAREILTLVAWIGAGFVAYYGSGVGAPLIKPLLSDIEVSEYGLKLVASVPIFFVTLMLLSALSMVISGHILSSRIGVIDRTLGFAYGLARGVVIFSLAYLFASKFQLEDMLQPFTEKALSLDLIHLVSNTLDQVIVIDDIVPPGN